MKYCPVMPPKAAYLLEEVKHENMGYFCYADVAYENDQYTDFMTRQNYVVLDCPIMEKGRILTPKELRSVVEHVNPTFTIIPDKVFDMHETLVWFYNYCEAIAHPSMCGVLQGTTKDELIKCALEMNKYGLQRMAIPRISEKNGGVPRSVLLRILREDLPHIQWHMLGANFPYLDEFRVAEMASSCDTAEPVSASLELTFLTKHSTERPDGFLEKGIEHFDRDWLRHNIRSVCRWFEHGLLS